MVKISTNRAGDVLPGNILKIRQQCGIRLCNGNKVAVRARGDQPVCFVGFLLRARVLWR